MPSTSTRRDLLRYLGGAGALSTSALAGCLDGSSGGRSRGSEPTTVAHATERSTPKSTEAAQTGPARTLGDIRVAVTDPVARKAVAYESVMGSGGVLAPAGRQFVVAVARSAVGSAEFDAGGEPPRDAFSRVAGDDSYPTVDIAGMTTGAYTTALAGQGKVGYGTSLADGLPEGWIAFEPPSPLDVDAAEIRCEYLGETASWSLPETAVAVLGRPVPTFELRSFDAKSVDGRVEVSLVAENTGTVDGEFLTAVYWPTERIADDDESTVVRADVAAGERIERTLVFDTKYTAFEDGPVIAKLDGVVAGSATVKVDVPTTTR